MPSPAEPDPVSDLIVQVYPRLLGLARNKLPQPLRGQLDPEDVVVSAIKSGFDRYRDRFPTDAEAVWRLFATIVRHKIVDKGREAGAAKRDVGRTVPLAADSAPGAQPVEEPPVPDFVIRESLDALLARVPPTHREILILRVVEGLTADATGQKLDLSRDQVNRRYKEAIETLREALGRTA
jgi:RNA polymerase sigma-70 factor (ECF subfamily)